MLYTLNLHSYMSSLLFKLKKIRNSDSSSIFDYVLIYN